MRLYFVHMYMKFGVQIYNCVPVRDTTGAYIRFQYLHASPLTFRQSFPYFCVLTEHASFPH